jgi:hypothetical protein
MVRRITKEKKLTMEDLHKYSYIYNKDTGDFGFVRTEIAVRPPCNY